MKPTRWIVARNRYLEAVSAWSEGGPVDEYPLRHWERFDVAAPTRSEAGLAAQTLRRKHKTLPPAQLALLKTLLAEVPTLDRPDGRYFDLDPEDAANARRLVAKDLLEMDENGRAALRLAAFNFQDFRDEAFRDPVRDGPPAAETVAAN